MSIYNQERSIAKSKAFKLTQKDLADYRIPVQVCLEYCKVLTPLHRELRKRALQAIGISAEFPETKVEWEHYLKLNYIMRPDPVKSQVTRSEYIEWMTKLFDPHQTGFTPNATVETIIDLMFSSDESADA